MSNSSLLTLGSAARVGETLIIQEVRKNCFTLVRSNSPAQFVPISAETTLTLMLSEQLRARHCVRDHAVEAVVCPFEPRTRVIELMVGGKTLPLHAFGTGVLAVVKKVKVDTDVRSVSVRTLES